MQIIFPTFHTSVKHSKTKFMTISDEKPPQMKFSNTAIGIKHVLYALTSTGPRGWL